MKNFRKYMIFAVLSVFSLTLLTACGGEKTSKKLGSASSVVKKLESSKDETITLSSDILLTEPVTVVGNKEILGEGTIYFEASDMQDAYMFTVSEGATLSIGGNVTIDADDMAGVVHVAKGGTLTMKEQAVIQNASLEAANALVEGKLEMTGGFFKDANGHNIYNKNETTISGGEIAGSGNKYAGIFNEGALKQSGGKVTAAYNNIVNVSDSSFVWSAGSNENSIRDGVFVAEGASIKITSKDATLTNAGARGIIINGDGEITDVTITTSMDTLVKVGKNGTLTLSGGKISDAGLHGVENAGKMKMTGGTIFANFNCGIVNTGTLEVTAGTIMNNENKGVLNKNGTATIVSKDVTLSGNRFAVANENNAHFELANAKILQSATSNIYAYDGTMYIHDIVLGSSGSNNVRVVYADVQMVDADVKGNSASGNSTMHGILMEGGTLDAKNVIIGNTTGNAIRNKGGQITGENITIKDVKQIGINNTVQDVTGLKGNITITGLTVENVKNNNVLIEDGKVTLINAVLGACQTNNIKVSGGELILNNSSVLGNAEGVKNNNHAVYMVGGKLTATDVKIENAAGSALRMNGETAVFNGKNVDVNQAGKYAIYQSIGTIILDDFTTSNVKERNVEMSDGTLSISNSTLGKVENNNMRIHNGTVTLSNVEIRGHVEGTANNVHGIFASNGMVTATELKISDVAGAAIRMGGSALFSGDNISVSDTGTYAVAVDGGVTSITNLTTEKAGGHNVYAYGTGKVTITDATLGTTTAHSVKSEADAMIYLKDVRIDGATGKAMYGILAQGGDVEAEEVTISNAKGAGIRVNRETSEVEIKNVTVVDAPLGVSASAGTVILTGFDYTTPGLEDKTQTQNLLVEGANVTVLDTTLNPVRHTNNIKISKGSLTLKNVEILGHTAGNGGCHGIFVDGGTLKATNINIQDTKGSAVRVKGSDQSAKVFVDGATFTNIGVDGINATHSTTTLTGTITSDVKSYVVNACGGDIVLEDVILDGAKEYTLYVDHAGSQVTGKNVTMKNTTVGIYGKAGEVTITNLNSEADFQHVLVQGATVTLDTTKDGESLLGKTTSNSMKITSGTLNLNGVNLSGHKDSVKGNTTHGIFVDGGNLNATNISVSDTKGAAIRVKEAGHSAKVLVDGATFTNIGTDGIQASHSTTTLKGTIVSDVKAYVVNACGGDIVLENVTLDGAKEYAVYVDNADSQVLGENVTIKNAPIGIYGKAGAVTITDLTSDADYQHFLVEGAILTVNTSKDGDSVLGKTSGNGMKITSGTLNLTGVVMLGHKDSVKGTTTHGIFVDGGNLNVTDVTIQDTKGAAIRVKEAGHSARVLVNGATFSNIGTDAIQASHSITTLTGTITSDVKSYVVNACGGDIVLDDVTLDGAKEYAVYVDNADSQVFGENVTIKNAPIGIYGKAGEVTITNLTSDADYQHFFVEGATLTINTTQNGDSVLGKTSGNGMKITSGTITLNDVSLLGHKDSVKGNTTHGIFVDGGTLNATNLSVEGTKGAAIRIRGNAGTPSVILDTVSFKNIGTNGIQANGGETTIVNLTAEDIGNYGIELYNCTVSVKNVNNTVNSKAVIYNSGTLNVSGAINAIVNSEKSATIYAEEALTGGNLVLDWNKTDDVVNIPDNSVGIQFANDEVATASKGYISLGENAGEDYVTYVYGNEILLMDKNNVVYTVKNYEELVNVLKNIDEQGVSAATITVAGNIDATALITIKANTNIRIQDDETERTIHCPYGIKVENGAILTLTSTGMNTAPKLVLTGNAEGTACAYTTESCSLITNNGALNVNKGVKFTSHVCDKENHNGLAIYTTSGATTTFKGIMDGIKGTHSSALGSAMVVDGGTLVLENAIISNNESGKYAVIGVINSGAIRATETTFTGNKAADTCGVAYVKSATEAIFTDCTFTGNSAVNGAGVLGTDATITITGCTFESNVATASGSQGGALGLWAKNCVVTDCTFTGNSAGEGGAVTISNNRSVSFTDCIFTDNTATKSGTGNLATWGKDIRLGGAGSVLNISGKMVAEIFHRNTSCVNVVGNLTEGSKVVIDWSANETARIPKGTTPAITFTSNGTASEDVMTESLPYITLGANMDDCGFYVSKNRPEAKIYLVQPTVVTTESELKTAISNAKEGVTSYIEIGANFTLSSTISIPKNTEIIIQNDGSERVITRATSFSTTARGVLFDVNANALLTFRTIGTDSASKLIFDGNNANIEATSANWAMLCAAEEANCTIYIENGVEFINNTSTGAGSVIRMQANGGTVYINGARFANNKANNNQGGVLYMLSGTTAYITDSVFDTNSAKNGGAIYAEAGATVTITDSQFTGNAANVEYGGAIWNKGTVTITDCQFTGNTSVLNGGAIWNQGTLTLEGTNADKAIMENNIASKWSGAVHVDGSSTAVTMDGYTFKGNSATAGGAMVLFASTEITNCTFQGNSATATNNHGGAIYSTVSQTVKNCEFISNTSNAQGGAIYISGGTFTVENSKFTSNTATGFGGAISHEKGTLVLTGTNADMAVFADNISSNYGGAVYTKATSFTAEGYTFSGNKGTYGGALLLFTDTTLTNCSFQNNQSTSAEGGAIYVNTNSTFTDCYFDGNVAKSNGGAICFAGSGKTVNLVATTAEDRKRMFTNNTAATYGGAVYVYAGTFKVSGYTFTNNTPIDIYVNTGKGGALSDECDGDYTTN